MNLSEQKIVILKDFLLPVLFEWVKIYIDKMKIILLVLQIRSRS